MPTIEDLSWAVWWTSEVQMEARLIAKELGTYDWSRHSLNWARYDVICSWATTKQENA